MSAAPAARLTPERKAALMRWVIIVGFAIVGLVLSYILLTAFVPRWWAQSIGRSVDGRIGSGIGLGMFWGTVFTVLPVLLVAQVRRTAWPRSWRIAAGVVGVALTAPNLVTLGITLGTTRAAQAADRVLDVQAPGFRYATLAGAIIGFLVGVTAVVFSVIYERRMRELRTLRARVAAGGGKS